jgi:uncharacterized membrane protein
MFVPGNTTVSLPDDIQNGTIADLLKVESVENTLTDRIAGKITKFTGSMAFIGLHVVWFTTWIVFNILWLGHPIDPFPFTLLTMIVSLEAIFLSAFILIAENRQSRLADRRARVDLQIDMIAEREITKLVRMVEDIQSELKIRRQSDGELESMRRRTKVDALTAAAQQAENNGSESKGKNKSDSDQVTNPNHSNT